MPSNSKRRPFKITLSILTALGGIAITLILNLTGNSLTQLLGIPLNTGLPSLLMDAFLGLAMALVLIGAMVLIATLFNTKGFAKKLGWGFLLSFVVMAPVYLMVTNFLFPQASIAKAMGMTGNIINLVDFFYLALATLGIVIAGLLLNIIFSGSYGKREKLAARIVLTLLTLGMIVGATITLNLSGNSLSQLTGISLQSGLSILFVDVALGVAITLACLGGVSLVSSLLSVKDLPKKLKWNFVVSFILVGIGYLFLTNTFFPQASIAKLMNVPTSLINMVDFFYASLATFGLVMAAVLFYVAVSNHHSKREKLTAKAVLGITTILGGTTVAMTFNLTGNTVTQNLGVDTLLGFGITFVCVLIIARIAHSTEKYTIKLNNSEKTINLDTTYACHNSYDNDYVKRSTLEAFENTENPNDFEVSINQRNKTITLTKPK